VSWVTKKGGRPHLIASEQTKEIAPRRAILATRGEM
jgi:hypothetical protein